MPYHFIHPETKNLMAEMHDRGQTRSQIAANLPFSRWTVDRVVSLYENTDQVRRAPLQAGRPRVLNGMQVNYLEGIVERQPDVYTKELQQALFEAYDVLVDRTTISRSLHRRGWTQKKPTIIPKEANEADRARFQAEIGNYPPDYLVCVDESACNRHTSRRQLARSPRNTRARRHDYFVRGQRYSVLPAISLDGVLHLDILTRSWTAAEFRRYIESLLDNMNLYPARNSVLVMDNATIHHFEGLREMVEARGMRLVYLPAYSPDLNPIEEGFSSMKAWLRDNYDYWLMETSDAPGTDPIALLWRAVFSSMTPDKIAGWYRDSGYF